MLGIEGFSSIGASHANVAEHACSVSDFFVAGCEANACGGFMRICFSARRHILTTANCIHGMSVGPPLVLKDSEHTYIHPYIHTYICTYIQNTHTCMQVG